MFQGTTARNDHKNEIRLFKDAAPGSESWDWEEKSGNRNSTGIATVWNVVHPTITLFQPEPGKQNGTSIIICPGGGFHFLAIDHEGSHVAKVLVQMGITVFLLKYRLLYIDSDNPFDDMINAPDKKAWDNETEPVIPLAIADGREAIAFVRRNAAGYGLATDRIGITGFSAGGLVAASAAFNYQAENRPDFVVAVYPDMPESRQSPLFPDAPPIFLLCATDDELGFPSHVISLYNRWFQAKRSAEMHLFAKGGHGFGTGTVKNTTDKWLDQFVKWLQVEDLM
jgi:acetyl esterase/lipase